MTAEEWAAIQDLLPEDRSGTVWWVNQGQTYEQERVGGFLWAPQRTKAGHGVSHHTDMAKLVVGDVVVSYANKFIRALSTVSRATVEQNRPSELPDDTRGREGFLARLDYFELASPIALSEIDTELRVPESGPFTKTGSVTQGYLYRLGDGAVSDIRSTFRDRWPEGSPWYDQKAVTDRAIHLHSESEETLTMEWLVEETLWDESRLEEVLEAMTTTRQVVLAGPPGTGKTWVAERIARYLASGNPLAVRTVQFHPSYGYEEFIEGLRPAMNDQGALVFDVQPGVVRTMVDQIDNPAQNYVLVIDEMNRANLPRVFGELMYLFEYRDKPIHLQYTSDFTLPENLSFIGTMNTADRSIRAIDIALRRRFDVFECPPEPEILDRYYAHPDHQNAVVDDLVDGFVELNRRLEEHLDRHHSIGHTFFMNDSFTHKRLKQVWDRQLKPLIEEYFFDQPDIASEYEVGAFWQVDG